MVSCQHGPRVTVGLLVLDLPCKILSLVSSAVIYNHTRVRRRNYNFLSGEKVTIILLIGRNEENKIDHALILLTYLERFTVHCTVIIIEITAAVGEY